MGLSEQKLFSKTLWVLGQFERTTHYNEQFSMAVFFWLYFCTEVSILLDVWRNTAEIHGERENERERAEGWGAERELENEREGIFAMVIWKDKRRGESDLNLKCSLSVLVWSCFPIILYSGFTWGAEEEEEENDDGVDEKDDEDVVVVVVDVDVDVDDDDDDGTLVLPLCVSCDLNTSEWH